MTFYCACALCCGPLADGLTASGRPPAEGRTAAANWCPLGTVIEIEGIGLRVVEDRMAARFGNRVDVYVKSHGKAARLGKMNAPVRIVSLPGKMQFQPGERALLFQGDFRLLLPEVNGVFVVTDPPYGIGYCLHGRSSPLPQRRQLIVGDEDQSAGLELLRWAEKRELPVAVFASPWKPWPGKWRNLIVWDKSASVGAGGDPATCLKRTWELIQVARNPSIRIRDESVWRFPIQGKDFEDHPAAKPVKLMRRLLRTFVPQGAVVFDPFMGSGPTGVAAMEEGMRFIGAEADSASFRVALQEIRSAAAQLNLFEPETAPTQTNLPLRGDEDEPRCSCAKPEIAENQCLGCGKTYSLCLGCGLPTPNHECRCSEIQTF